MSNYHDSPIDLKSLIGDEVYSGYLHQEQERELSQGSTRHRVVKDDTRTCPLCNQPIDLQSEINWHHPQYKSRGGKETICLHAECHVRYHSQKNDFREWGRIGGQISALSKRWALNLLNVRTDPRHEINRSFYRAFYSH